MRTALLVCALLGVCAPAAAQDADAQEAPKKAGRKGDVVKKKTVGNKNVYVIDQEMLVEGRTARPQALFIVTPPQITPAAPAGAPGWLAVLPEAWAAEELAQRRIGQRRAHLARAQARRKEAGLVAHPAWERERVRLEQIAGARDQQARRLRDDTIARIEKLLAAGPAGPEDAYAFDLLAHLYARQAEDDWQQAMDGFDQALAADPLAAEPPAAPDYAKAVAAWWQIVQLFPTYAGRDAVVYMLAWVAGATSAGSASFPAGPFGGVDPQRYLLGALVCPNRYPLPPAGAPPAGYDGCTAAGAATALRADAWFRLGQHHFEQPGELPLAVTALEQALATGQAAVRAPALYTLAWALYRLDRMEQALRRFDEVVATPQDAASTAMRAEAIQYIAVVLTDPWAGQWETDPGEALARAERFYQGRDAEPHVHDVWAQLGVALADLIHYTEAARALRTAVDRWPLHRDNPTAHERLIDVLVRSGDYAGAARERAAVVDRYGRSSAWERANAGQRGALDARDRVLERALREAALQGHAEAQQNRQQSAGEPARTSDGYLRAAELYRRYLELYPASPDAARMAFLRGEALYWGGRAADAVAAYRAVLARADAPASLREPAALGVVNAWSAQVSALPDQPAEPSAAELRAGGKPARVPAAVVELRGAIDGYLAIAGQAPGATRLELSAARAALRWRDLADAEKRLNAFLDRHCTDADAPAAKQMLLTLYDGQQRHAEFEATVRRLADRGCAGRGQTSDPADFEIATKYGNVGNPERAAETFYQAYRRLGTDHAKSSQALYQAASAWEKAGMLHHAFAAYRELTDTPALSNSPYFVPALQGKAALLERLFDHSSAAAEYVRAARLAGQPGRALPPGFDRDATRRDALARAAALLELERAYHDRGEDSPGAATLYVQAAQLEKDDLRAMDLHFRAALAYAHAGDEKAMVRVSDQWERRFAERPEAPAYRVRFRFELGRLRERLGRGERALEDFRRAAEYHQKNGVTEPQATALAAEAWLRVAEDLYLRKLTAAQPTWAELAAFEASAAEVRAAFHRVIALKVDALAVAAMVRLGDIDLLVAERTAALVPADLPRSDRQARGKAIAEVRKRARGMWTTAAMGRGGEADRWSREARSRLRDHFGVTKYRALRPALIETEVEP